MITIGFEIIFPVPSIKLLAISAVFWAEIDHEIRKSEANKKDFMSKGFCLI